MMDVVRIACILVSSTVLVGGLTSHSWMDCVDDWPDTHSKDNDTSGCSFTVAPDSINSFSKNIDQNGYNIAYLDLVFRNVTLRWTRCVVEAQKWVWTYAGVSGAKAYLTWPVEYNVLSLGLLDTHTLRNQRVELESKGHCNLVIGRSETFYVMEALANMTAKLIADSEDGVKYDESVWCYKERTIVANEKWWMCQYVICPFEAVAYRCCGWDNYRHGNEKVIKCKFTKSQLQWFLPFILGSFIYLYSPIFLFGIVGFLYRKCSLKQGRSLNVCRGVSVEYGTFPNLAYPFESMQEDLTTDIDVEEDEDVIFYNPVQCSSVFVCFRRSVCCVPKRCFRCLFVAACLSVLLIKLILYYYTERHFIQESVRQNVPMGFLSILAKDKGPYINYLAYFNGPVSALVVFFVFSLAFTCLPNDLATFLSKGLTEDNNGISTSPLTSDISIKTKFGSLQSIRDVNGYTKMKMIMISHILILLNIKFWKYCFLIDLARWNSFMKRRSKIRCLLVSVMFPIYCVVCLFESLLCVIYFGIPIVFLFITCIKVYCGAVVNLSLYQSIVFGIFKSVLTVVVFTVLLILLYLFSIIFVDSFVFLSQVLTYTYTGLFANPDVSYGYIILAITIFMYIFDSINFIHSVYDDLFVHVRDVCVKLTEDKKYPEIQLVFSFDGFNGISKKLFTYVIQTTRPIRKEIFVTVLKIGFIASVLFFSVFLLSEFQDFRRMSDLMQAAVTIFVCLLPKIINCVCQVNETKWQIKRSVELRNAVHYYCRREMKRGRAFAL